MAGLPASHRTLTFASGSQPSCQGNQAGVLGSSDDEELCSKGKEQDLSLALILGIMKP